MARRPQVVPLLLVLAMSSCSLPLAGCSPSSETKDAKATGTLNENANVWGGAGGAAVPWRPATECGACSCGAAHIVISSNVSVIVGGTVGDDDCTRLEEVDIPSHVQAIGAWAFYQATNLVAVNMAQHGRVLRRIEAYAFQGCSRLASVASRFAARLAPRPRPRPRGHLF